MPQNCTDWASQLPVTTNWIVLWRVPNSCLSLRRRNLNHLPFCHRKFWTMRRKTRCSGFNCGKNAGCRTYHWKCSGRYFVCPTPLSFTSWPNGTECKFVYSPFPQSGQQRQALYLVHYGGILTIIAGTKASNVKGRRKHLTFQNGTNILNLRWNYALRTST